MQLLLSLLLNSLALVITDYLLPGFEINNIQTTVVAAIVLGLLNTFIKPILSFLTLPFTLLTFGLFAFVVNAVVLWLVTALVPGVYLDSFWSALLAAVVLSLVSTILSMLFKDLGK